MLISPQELIHRTRRRRGRGEDLALLRQRFAEAPTAKDAGPEVVAKARRLRLLRRKMAELLLDVQTCRGCARGQAGAWEGGHCCGSDTLKIFTHEEVATLKLGGTTLRDLTPPDNHVAGCVFRGEHGCSLEPANRANICLQYACTPLREELRAKRRWQQIARLRRAMFRAFPEACTIR